MAVLSAVCLLLVALPPSRSLAAEWRWSGVERIVAVSDVHGALGAMTATLTNAKVIDEELRWGGGATHLVITGDILDRGPDSRKVMDLIMRLEKEAADAGGRVHLLLGNHEVMNLVGDLRYVSREEYAAFADDESAEDRERWFQVFRVSRPENPDEESLRLEYNDKYPTGFFGLRRAFGTHGAYGPWLMS
ncbi:MAG: metallophosphoesterase, partial [Woeseiaceae bacterium]